MGEENELLQLMDRVGDELGADVYEAACQRARALAKKSAPRKGYQSCQFVWPQDRAYAEHLRTELRRLLRLHRKGPR